MTVYCLMVHKAMLDQDDRNANKQVSNAANMIASFTIVSIMWLVSVIISFIVHFAGKIGL